MIRHYLKIAFRELGKNRLTSVIKISGLAVAIMVCISILSWARYELSYDRFHEDSESIYRILLRDIGAVSIAPPFKTQVLEKIPEVEASTRLFNASFLGGKTKVSAGERVFVDDEIYYADAGFFDVFTFPFVSGDKSSALERPNAVVITQSTARKYFGDEDPVGQALLLSGDRELEITGVVTDVPKNSHFHFDLLVTMKAMPWDVESIGFGSAWIFKTYLKTVDRADPDVVAGKIRGVMDGLKETFPYIPDSDIALQPLTEIHLHSHFDRELEANGDIRNIYIYLTIAFLVLFVAAINYINLTTARSAERAKEISVRKISGAGRKQIVLQFMGEAVFASVLAFAIALAGLKVLQPLLSSLGAGFLYSGFEISGFMVLAGIAIAVGLGAATGYFPAMVISKFDPAKAMKSGYNPAGRKGGIRKVLVILQFSISIVLIFGTLVIYRQMMFVQNMKLGYEKDHVVVLNVGYPGFYDTAVLLKDAFTADASVVSASIVSQLPADILTAEYIDFAEDREEGAYYMSVDRDFFETAGIRVIRGRERIEMRGGVAPADQASLQNYFVVNQATLEMMGLGEEEAVGEKMRIRHGNMEEGTIIGVVEDFHFQSLHNPIRPLVFEFDPFNYEFILVKIDSSDIPGTISSIRESWARIAGDIPFDHFFLDDTFQRLYREEQAAAKLLLAFSVISILIISMGLIGLTSFTTTRRFKEIGVRKVVGATTANIVVLLSKEFAIWVAAANLIAWPVAWLVMNKWLQNFSYRAGISFWMFLLAGAIALLLTVITVSSQALRAATANPVKALKCE